MLFVISESGFNIFKQDVHKTFMQMCCSESNGFDYYGIFRYIITSQLLYNYNLSLVFRSIRSLYMPEIISIHFKTKFS